MTILVDDGCLLGNCKEDCSGGGAEGEMLEKNAQGCNRPQAAVRGGGQGKGGRGGRSLFPAAGGGGVRHLPLMLLPGCLLTWKQNWVGAAEAKSDTHAATPEGGREGGPRRAQAGQE